MAITKVQSNAAASSSTSLTSLAVTLGTGVTSGNLLVATPENHSNTTVVTGPTGWSQAAINQTGGTGAMMATIWYRVVDGTDAGTTSWTFNFSTSKPMVINIAEFSATNGWATTILDQTAIGNTGTATATVISSGTTATTNQAEELWVGSLVYKSAQQTETGLTAGWTKELDTPDGGNTFVGTLLWEAVNATGTAHVEYTIGSARYWAGCVATFQTALTGGGGLSASGTAAGVGTLSNAEPLVSHPLAGTANGVGLLKNTGSPVSHSFVGEADGVATASSTVSTTPPPTGFSGSGAANGVSTPVATLTVSHSLVGTTLGVANTNSLITIPVISPYQLNNPIAPTIVSYSVRVRAPAPGRTLIGQISSFRKLSIIRRFNDVSDWAIELDADDPLAPYLTTPGYGISITRTVSSVFSGSVVSSRVEIAGPMLGISRQMASNTLIAHGKDDMVELTRRLALPVTNYPFSGLVSATSPTHWYKLNDTSGTSAVDSGSSPANGTYTGGFTLGQTGVIDDSAYPSTTLNGTTGTITGVGPGPTGNNSYTMTIFVNPLASPPGSNQLLAYWGTWGTLRAAPHIAFFSNGVPYAGTYSDDTATTGAAYTIGVPMALTATYNSATLLLSLYVGTLATPTALFNSKTLGGTPAFGTGTGKIGSNGASTNFFNGQVSNCIIHNSVLTLSQITNIQMQGLSRFAASAYDAQTGVCETVLKHYVGFNAGPSAISERRVSGLAIETDSARGTTVYGNARFNRLVAPDGTGILQTLALAGGGLGFNVQKVNGVLTFVVYSPADHTSSVIFSEDLGNLLDFTYSRDAPDPEQGGNVVVVAGGDQLTSRVIVNQSDPNSINAWGRTEFFQDARDTTDMPTMQQRGQTVLQSSTEIDQFTATLTQIPQMQYGVDFNLGDKVTAVIDGALFQDQIREVDITLEQGKEEVVTPIMGTPNAVLVQNAVLKYRRQALKANNNLKLLQTST